VAEQVQLGEVLELEQQRLELEQEQDVQQVLELLQERELP